ncbi:hypothetical protein EUTSA_v10019755mg [Eutrema salsugineum]|uniref:Response regulatory domain-containing protein n=1 Tax=Eutrema salsugineum TaxID=72664 RepID=V4MB84_EUTSA|nr:putative two-component response regulator-like APRR6 [Eutrema salsugineum]ESQ28456.1 hypothetical protein EUTSA_v10019755mg [Eutrema salsugineum]
MTEKLTLNLAGNTTAEHISDISVLIVDNDTTSIEYLTSMLKQFSDKVMSVNMASDALSMIEKQKDIGLVIANTEMPRIDSHSFLTALLHKEIPLILIHPEINTKEASDLLTKSTHFCLKKPISESDIKNLWQHVVPKESQKLEKINISEQQEKVVEKTMLNQIESFRETIKRQRISQSSLLGKQPFVKTFTTPKTYQKRKEKAIDEGNTKPVYPTEAENKREEGIKMGSNIGRRCNVWTQERQMKFLTAISILGEKDSRPKSILSIMNDADLNLRQVGSHLQKYKAQVELMNDSLSRNEWRSTDKIFNYPSDYKYPFNASNLAKNIVESNTKWYSLRKKEASSSSIDQYSFKKSADKGKAKMMPKFHLGGKLDLSKHSLFDNVLNKSPMEFKYVPSATSNKPHVLSSTNDVNNSVLSSDNPPVLSGLPLSVDASNHSGLSNNLPVLFGLPSSVGASKHNGLGYDSPSVLSGLPSNVGVPNHNGLSDNPSVLSGLPTSVGASNTDAFQMGSSEICIAQSEPNPFQPSSSVLEIDWNQLDLDPISTPDPYVPLADLCTIGESYFLPDLVFTMNPLETNMDQIGWIPSTDNISDETNMNQMGWTPSTENFSHPETNMNQMDWIPTLENYVFPQTDMNINVPETNTTHMGWVSSREGYVASENIIPSEISNQMDRVSYGENHVLSQDIISHVGFATGQTNYETPSQTNTDQMNWLFSEESFLLLEDIPFLETITAQTLETNMEDTSLVPYVEDTDCPIEELISLDIDVNEMDIDCWFGNYGSSEENIPLSTMYIGHDSAFNSLMDSTPHSTMENNDQSLGMNLESTSQQHNMMEPCRYQHMKTENPREAMEGGDHFDDDPECMSWIDEMINDNA